MMFQNIGSVIESIEDMSAGYYAGSQPNGAAELVISILSTIDAYVKKHGSIALSCGGEFVYQDDKAQVDAISYFVDILEDVAHYVDPGDEEE